MCGIAGWLGTPPPDPEQIARITALLKHRGPDAQDARVWPGAGLIHTRLSIIDLTEAGRQPLSNEDGTVWTVFNGEIYNHRELRKGLIARGHRIAGRCDAEILPHLYEEKGEEFLRELKGMFALALLDRRKGLLLLARDRFGIKPLFYAPGRTRTAFASELNALRTFPGIDLDPDPQSLQDYTALFYIPAPATFYKGIRAVEPGQAVTFSPGGGGSLTVAINRYHAWTMAPDLSLTMGQAAQRAEEALHQAVASQLESDVPLGALLSGGIDSSLVSAFAQKNLDDPLLTFNVQFPEEAYDETWAAQAVAAHIGSRHRTLSMEERQGSWNQITDLLGHAGQPYADTSLFPVAAICRQMRRHVTVALSGDGGDEGFGGYDLYWRLAGVARLQRLPRPIWTGAGFALGRLIRAGLINPALLSKVRYLTLSDDVDIMQRLYSWVREEDHQRLCGSRGLLPLRRLFEPQWLYDLPRQAGRIERLSAHATEIVIRLVLANDFLFKVDTASMRESLEIRVPMLDEDLFAFGLTLPFPLKVKGRTCKQVLRRLAAMYLPHDVAVKPKRGFCIPMDAWIDRDFKDRIRDSLLGPASPLKDHLNPDVYRPWIHHFIEGRPVTGMTREGLYQRVFMLLSLWLVLTRKPESA